jgi:hypothetical protein
MERIGMVRDPHGDFDLRASPKAIRCDLMSATGHVATRGGPQRRLPHERRPGLPVLILACVYLNYNLLRE